MVKKIQEAKKNNKLFVKKNKKAWISVVESFLSISVIILFISILISGNNSQNEFNTEIYEQEVKILKLIQRNDSLREDILEPGPPPVFWNNTKFPTSIKEIINSEKPAYLNCTAIICKINDKCLYEGDLEINIYSRSVGIFTDRKEYDSRQLRLFCWQNNL